MLRVMTSLVGLLTAGTRLVRSFAISNLACMPLVR
jgi:hypothetical protein